MIKIHMSAGITIDNQKKISGVQEEFNTIFPYLRLDFFLKTPAHDMVAPGNFVNHNNKTLGECRTIKGSKEIIITPDMTVANLEHDFKTIYGLGVQVFRKSGKSWIETTVTDGWTLEEQNKQGESLSAGAMERTDSLPG